MRHARSIREAESDVVSLVTITNQLYVWAREALSASGDDQAASCPVVQLSISPTRRALACHP